MISYDVASKIWQALDGGCGGVVAGVDWAGPGAGRVPLHHVHGVRVRAVRGMVVVQIDIIKIRVESAYGVCNQRLKLKYDEPPSNFAFNVNLRRYNLFRRCAPLITRVVGRCRLPVSKPVLKAPMLSALETGTS